MTALQLKAHFNSCLLPRFLSVSQARLYPHICFTHCRLLVLLDVVAAGSFNERWSQTKECERNGLDFRNGTIGIWTTDLSLISCVVWGKNCLLPEICKMKIIALTGLRFYKNIMRKFIYFAWIKKNMQHLFWGKGTTMPRNQLVMSVLSKWDQGQAWVMNTRSQLCNWCRRFPRG